MVYNKIIILIVFINLSFASIGCASFETARGSKHISKIDLCVEEVKTYDDLDAISFCSNKIVNRNLNCKYFRFINLDCLESYLKRESDLKNQELIRDFINGSNDCNAYLCVGGDRKFVIIAGNAIGTSGIGYLYWNYMYTDLRDDINYRSSLIKNPFSFQLINSKVYFVEITDNFTIEEYEEKDSLDLFIIKYLDDKIEKKESFTCEINTR